MGQKDCSMLSVATARWTQVTGSWNSWGSISLSFSLSLEAYLRLPHGMAVSGY